MSRKKISKITFTDFEDSKLKIDGLVIIECFEDIEGPLYIMDPVLKKLKNKYRSEYSHYRINTAEEAWCIREFQIKYYPTYLIFCNGELFEKIEGVIPLLDLLNILENQNNPSI